MDRKAQAISLVDYLQSLDDFVMIDYFDGNYGHMGATISDAILQAGTTYETVVRPRIKRIREVYSEAVTTSEFWRLLQEKGSKAVLSWKDDEKPRRVVGFTKFLLEEGIETEGALSEWIESDSNRARLLKVRGIGPKTADYIKILVGSQTAAVDRHVFRLLSEAGLETSNYEEAKEILNLAADIFGVERALFDHSIWQYMSKRDKLKSKKFPC
ncbi:MAG: hypothetical protein H8D96_07995 [Desulfobacterales bacterium]|uniref:HhH-GPD domain-containing protein n=1 Tax=Candidatus Desulfatibia vada TaxID=2841696 RepID=A0A8J6NTE4_9BACT|nr:hypothetical protein [Candidatus Desulfatibia vada]